MNIDKIYVMKTLASTLLTILTVVLLTSSFTNKQSPDKMVSGIYGICNMENGAGAKIELSVNDDHTFHYYNSFDKTKIIDVKGKWTLNGNTILLSDFESEFAIHDKWSIDTKYQCIKSRKGWTRLCHLN